MAWRENASFGNVKARSIQSVTPVITVGAEAANVVNVAVQLKDFEGKDVSESRMIKCYLAKDANGAAILDSSVCPSAFAIGTDGLAIQQVQNRCYDLVSESDGDIDFNVTWAGSHTCYAIFVDPADGSLTASSVLTFST